MKSILFAIVLALSCYGVASAQNTTKKKAAPAAAPKAKGAKPAKKAAAPAKAAAPEVDPAQLASSFQDFCKSWQAKLSEREARNKTLIQWDTGANWVQGTYTGFAPDANCRVESNGGTTVGKMTYLEVKYEKRGTTIEDAQSQPPHALETTEVTEIFRNENGEWVY